MKLSILIPVYNEEKTIEKLIKAVKSVPLEKKGIQKELIVVDDCSKDSTLAILKKIKGIKLIGHKKNMGKGAAIRTAIEHATGDILIVQDADLEYNPNEYYKIIRPIIEGKAKVVYGSRFLSQSQKQKNKLFLRKHNGSYYLAYIGGRLITITTNILFFSRLTDEPTCYKTFRKDVIKSIPFKGNRFEWEPEVTAKILKKGIKIHEVPISYSPRTNEEGKKIGFKDGFQAIWTLMKYRFVD